MHGMCYELPEGGTLNSVKYFNKRITAEGFEINQENLLMVMIESLLCCNKKFN